MTYKEKMSAIQSALKSINDDGYIDIANHGCPDERNELEVIKEALEKQVPKKPKKRVRGVYGDDSNDWLYDEEWDRCPTCRKDKEVYKGWDYCPLCGQRIDWRDYE